MNEQLRRGQYVRVRLAGDQDWCRAIVAVASDTVQSSVMLMLDGAVRTSDGGLIANTLPLTIDYEKETVTSLFGGEYEIEVADA